MLVIQGETRYENVKHGLRKRRAKRTKVEEVNNPRLRNIVSFELIFSTHKIYPASWIFPQRLLTSQVRLIPCP